MSKSRRDKGAVITRRKKQDSDITCYATDMSRQSQKNKEMTEEMKAEEERWGLKGGGEKRENIHLDSRVVRFRNIICKLWTDRQRVKSLANLVVEKSGGGRVEAEVCHDRETAWQEER